MPSDPRLRKKLPSQFAGRDFDPQEGGRPKDGNLFIWTIVILLLIGFAIACWIGSFYIFGHPEKPFSYQVLNKLKKLDPPKRFELTAAPRGEFLKASQIWDRFGKLAPRELARANEALLRNYLRNFKLSQDLVPYVIGTYNILDSYELTGGDFIGTGVVALAQSRESSRVLLEQVFSADAKVVPALQRTLLTGFDIDLKRENELSAIIHVERLPDGRIKATAISILYPSYESATASGTFTLDPPQELNVAAGLPIITARRQEDADKKYAGFRKRAGLPESTQEAISQNRLMRVERPVAVNTPQASGEPTPTPVPAVADVKAVPPAIPVQPVAAPVAAFPEASATPQQVQPPPPSPSLTPGGVVASSTGAWPTYEPGQMPRGRLLNIKDVSTMSGADVSSERVYLQGNFVVTAAGQNRAVLRTQGAIAQAIGFGGRSGNVRVIVEFPAGVRPPGEGATFSRDARRPFQITDVREGADGQVNVNVREVTRP
ncbi:MAG: hypothetical protein WC003_06325 [Terrimicrobiaceae bacterium]